MATIAVGIVEPTPLGRLWLSVSEEGLVALDWGIPKTNLLARLRRRKGAVTLRDDPARTRQAACQLGEYFRAQRRHFDLPIDWSHMPDFQRRVLQAVCAIPYGQTVSYADIARRIGHPQAGRAVGRANAANPLPIIIPCHRVIGADGSLRGYGAPGGIALKARLLGWERGNGELAGTTGCL